MPALPTADWVLTGASRLVTVEPMLGTGALGVVERGAVAAREGTIIWVGPESGLPQAVDATGAVHHDAAGRAVLPGFVDSHTHFIFAGDRAEEFHLRHAGVSYEELARQGRGILSTVAATRAASATSLRDLGRARLRSFASHGTTTVEGKTGYGLDLDTESRCLAVMGELAGEPELARVVPTFLGAHTVPPEYRGTASARSRYLDLVCDEMLPRFVGQARFCDVFCEATAFTVPEARRVLERARSLGYLLKVHANQLGPSGGAALAAELGATSADHLDYASQGELEALAGAGVTGTLLPGCSFSLSTEYPQAARLNEARVTVALATDFNPGTSYSESMPMMIALAISAMGMTLEQALTAATMGGAHALGMAGEVGSLAPGKRCDLIILAGADERALGYHFGVNPVGTTIVGGHVIDQGAGD